MTEGHWVGVTVPTDDGRACSVEFHRRRSRYWSVDISDELIRQAPEGLTAALGLAVLEMKRLLEVADGTPG